MCINSLQLSICVLFSTHVFLVFKLIGSFAKGKSFFNDFLCGYLSKLPEAQQLVKLKERCGRRLLRLNDMENITNIYCHFNEQKDEVRRFSRNWKSAKSNFIHTMAQFEKDGSLAKVGFGMEFGKEYLKYEINDDELWRSLARNYSVSRQPHMVILT